MDDTSIASLQKRVRRQKKRYLRSVGVKDVLNACKQVPLKKHGIEIDWNYLIENYGKMHDDIADENKQGRAREDGDSDADSDDDDDAVEEDLSGEVKKVQLSDQDFISFEPHADWITIGLIGHPNVGKSSLINGIMGKKVVSASRTPGHTKHFQTIHLTPTVRLCDCPGLVFPSFIPKPLQILCGMYKIAQVQGNK